MNEKLKNQERKRNDLIGTDFVGTIVARTARSPCVQARMSGGCHETTGKGFG
jgi:hypothetical protein